MSTGCIIMCTMCLVFYSTHQQIRIRRLAENHRYTSFNDFTNLDQEICGRENVQRLGSAFLSGVANLRTTWKKQGMTNRKMHILLPLSNDQITLVSSRETSREEAELGMVAFGVIALTKPSLLSICRSGIV